MNAIPYNSEAEQSVLASIIIDESRYQEVNFLKPSDFWNEQNRRIWTAIQALDEGIDQITVAQKMKDMGTLRPERDLPHLSHIIAILPTCVHAKHYARIVQDLSERRQQIAKAGDLAQQAYSKPIPSWKVIKT